jgi:hypothetical protein
MKDELHILRSDDLGALIREYADRSWQGVGETVMEVLQETLDPQDAADMTPQEWVYQGFVQGAGHLIMALLAQEVRLELTGPQGRIEQIERALRRRQASIPGD